MMKQTTAWVMLGVFLLWGLGPQTAATAQSITLQKIRQIGSLKALHFGEAAWGDYDGDGDFDLFLTGAWRRFGRDVLFSQLYFNNGDTLVELDSGDAPLVRISRYSDALNPTAPSIENVWQSAVAWADYDRDGDLDVLSSGANSAGNATLRIYENVGGNDLLVSRFTLPGVRNGDLDWGDYDNDGDLDFVVCGIGQDDRPVSVLYQNDVATGGGFVRRDVGLMAVGFCSTEWGDYDNDGDLDLLMTGIAAPDAFATRLYRNDGDGSFSVFPADLKSLLYASVAWGDYDADGDLDILISGARLTPFIMEGEIKIYRNDSGSFTDVSDGLGGAFENDVTMGRYQGAAAWGDFNNDGLLDFFVTGARAPQSSDRGQIYRTHPNDQFTKLPSENFDGGFFGSAFGGDHDNDGDLDLFFIGEKVNGGLSVEVLRNGLRIRNTPPSAPDGLQATPQGNAVTLTWNPASDSQTPTPGLTYNLRVGTTPGGLDIVSPMSVPATGHRLVPRRGNAEHNTSWTLKNLPPGTYYWSVQALDNSFKGSPFAQEGTFIIGG